VQQDKKPEAGWRTWFRFGAARAAAGKAVLLKSWTTAELRFAEGTAQSRMLRYAPDRLLIDYTRTMLGALLWVREPKDIGMVGLGGGSQVKFLHKHLMTAKLEVFECDADVVAMRERFRIPKDDARLHVVLGDAARLLAQRVGAYDVLLVDGYDAAGIPAELSTQKFYNDCRASLREGGVLAANLYDTDHVQHVHRLKIAFGASNVRVLEETEQSNRVAFARVPPLDDVRAPMLLSEKGRRELEREFDRVAALFKS
jgi:spermidine synthase